MRTSRYSKLAGLLLCVVCVLSAFAAFAADVDKAVDALMAADAANEPTPFVEQFGVKDVPTAYAVQNVYVDRVLKNDRAVGFKGALTAAPLMKKFGASEPATAVLFASGCIKENNSVITKGSKRGVMLENEVGFRFSKRIGKPLKDAAELKACVSKIFAAIEVPLVGFDGLDKVKAYDLISANVGSWKFIVGEEFYTDKVSPNDVAVKMTLDGAVYNEGKGTDALGDQWNALLWIVNNAIANGRTIEVDDVVISGAMGKMLPAKPGKYEADFGALGKISFEVK